MSLTNVKLTFMHLLSQTWVVVEELGQRDLLKEFTDRFIFSKVFFKIKPC